MSPLERAALLLHDVFDYDFEQIADILGRSAPACRKLASRARVSVRARRPRFAGDAESHRIVVASFVEARRAGDAARIARLLAADATMDADGGGKVSATRPLRGASAIASLFGHIFKLFAREGTSVVVEPCCFNGSLGILIRENGVLATALSLDVTGGLVLAIHAQRNPDKLLRSGLASAQAAAVPGNLVRE